MAANAVLYSPEQIAAAASKAVRTGDDRDRLLPEDWSFIDRKDLSVRDDKATGLYANAYQASDRTIIIAFRSADDAQDRGLRNALQSGRGQRAAAADAGGFRWH